MKLLLFSDLHVDLDAARRLVSQSADVNLVVGAGDFGTVRRNLKKCIGALRAITCPAVLVPGNAESFDELREACADWPSAHVLHGSSVTIEGVSFYGVGGGIPVTPFGDWSYDFDEDEAAVLLAGCPSGGVLVTHSPPQGVLDADSGSRSLGSTAIRDAILNKKPVLAVCGHIHACGGQIAELGPTRVANAGPRGVVWAL